MKSLLVVVAALAACAKSESKPEQGTVVASRALEDLKITAAEGSAARYDRNTDSWQVPAGATTVHIDRADERYVASPDAFMQHVAPTRWKGKLVTIEHREQVGGHGFTATFAAFAGEKDPHPLRSTYVIRQAKRVWYECYADGTDDDATREHVLDVCRSVRAF